jgi:hypothetical protein
MCVEQTPLNLDAKQYASNCPPDARINQFEKMDDWDDLDDPLRWKRKFVLYLGNMRTPTAHCAVSSIVVTVSDTSDS